MESRRALIMFLVYVYDMPDEQIPYANIITDNTELMRQIWEGQCRQEL